MRGSNRQSAQPTEPLSRFQRQLPFQESPYDMSMPPLKGEVSLSKKVLTSLVDGEAGSPATATLSSLR